MRRMVNRGAKGIALIDEESRRPRLKYVFDVSDTHPVRADMPPPYLWSIREEHHGEVWEALTASFGEVPPTCDSFPDLLINSAVNAVEDHLLEYEKEFLHSRYPTELSEMPQALEMVRRLG